MRRIRIPRKPVRDWALFTGALVLLGWVRVCLTLFPFRIVRRTVDLLKISVSGLGDGLGDIPEADCIRAVLSASRFVPGATCLTQSLALEVALALRGIESRTRFGVAVAPHSVFKNGVFKNGAFKNGGFRAHAWVESRGMPVYGIAGHEQFVPLTPSGTIAS